MNFDTYAITWDTEKRVNRAKVISQEISKSIQIKKECNALEFGCGTGLLSFNLYNKFETLTLVDTSKGMIDTLNSKIEKYEIGNMKAYQIDINKEQIPSERKYDLIYTSMALHHISDTETTLKNLHRILKEDGCLCIIDLDEEDGSFHRSEKDFNGHNGFNQNDLKSLMINVGFKEVGVNTFYNDEKNVEGIKVSYSLFLMVGRK